MERNEPTSLLHLCINKFIPPDRILITFNIFEIKKHDLSPRGHERFQYKSPYYIQLSYITKTKKFTHSIYFCVQLGNA